MTDEELGKALMAFFPHKKYKYPCDNPVCRQCKFFSRSCICCDLYIMTGRHHKGCGKTCDSFEKGNKQFGKGIADTPNEFKNKD